MLVAYLEICDFSDTTIRCTHSARVPPFPRNPDRALVFFNRIGILGQLPYPGTAMFKRLRHWWNHTPVQGDTDHLDLADMFGVGENTPTSNLPASEPRVIKQSPTTLPPNEELSKKLFGEQQPRPRREPPPPTLD